jgi:hypothetical protein
VMVREFGSLGVLCGKSLEEIGIVGEDWMYYFGSNVKL